MKLPQLFYDWLEQQPSSVSRNVRESIERGESFTASAWLAGRASVIPPNKEFRKTEGAYTGSHWTLVGTAINLENDLRYVCESVDIPGLLHIFSPAQLEEVTE